MISIICVYNNKELLNKYLIRGLEHQTAKYELILVDNTDNKFKSAAEALNYGASKATGKYLMFVHQDVMLTSKTWLENVERILDDMPNLGVAGVAGRSEHSAGVITNIKHGVPPKPAGEIQITEPTEVQTVDECLFIIPRKIFNKLNFDEKTCNDWHLYAVDYCLSVKLLGFNVYVLPFEVYHLSDGIPKKSRFKIILDLGNLPKGYYSTLKNILKKYKRYYKKIYTTIGVWDTRIPVFIQRVLHLIHIPNKLIQSALKAQTNNS